MRDYDDYDDESIRLYTPLLQRVIILAAVIIAVPVVMWTITSFVRSYVARPKLPALEHLASTNTPARIPTNLAAPASPAPAPADQSPTQRVEGVPASDAPSPAVETDKPAPNPVALPDAEPASSAANSATASIQAAPMQAPSPAISAPATTAMGDASTAGPASASVASPPKPPRSTDNTASTGTPGSADRGVAWPNPNATSPPDFAAPRLPPPQPAPPPAGMAATEALPADEPIRGHVPLPRQRPGIFAMAATDAATGAATGVVSGRVPLPRARPADAPAEAANSTIEAPYGYRPGLGGD